MVKKQEKQLVEDFKRVVLDRENVIGLTRVSNLIITDDFRKMSYEEFREYFLVKYKDGVEYYIDKQKQYAYDKEQVDKSIKTLLKFYFGRNPKSDDYLELEFFVYQKPDMFPLIITVMEETALLIAPCNIDLIENKKVKI